MQLLVCVIRMGSLQDVGGNSQESDLQMTRRPRQQPHQFVAYQHWTNRYSK